MANVRFIDPGFLRVQRGFDTRPDLIGCRFHRGAILDAQNKVLAQDVPTGTLLIRKYPAGASSLHLVGYHHSIFGSAGLEKTFDAVLMGRRIADVGDFFRLLWNGFVHQQLHGNSIQLTIYSELQETAAALLQGKKGAIVAVDPRDGSILTMVSSPGFDPNTISQDGFRKLRDDRNSPFLNRTIQGLYPPGSTF